MKKFYIIILYFLIISPSNGNEISTKISQYISNLISGNGETEVSVDIRENAKPDFSILAVRELQKTDKGKYFTQISLFNTEKNNDERLVGNIGFGKRSLSEDNFLMTGFNAFVDLDNEGNKRTSLGYEAQNAVLDFNYNYYIGLDDAEGEVVLDGYDLRLASQVPYLHWADLFVNSYAWYGDSRDDVKGKKYGSEMLLTPNISLELAYDDKDKAGIEDEWYANIMFVHPPKNGPSARDGVAKTAWKENKNMSSELLTKVNRQNKIVVEFTGSATISRTD